MRTYITELTGFDNTLFTTMRHTISVRLIIQVTFERKLKKRKKLSHIHAWSHDIVYKALTPVSDHDRISLNDINTVTSRRMIRTKININ